MDSKTEFEKWYWDTYSLSHAPLNFDEALQMDNEGNYNLSCVQMTYDGWQACQSLNDAKIAEQQKIIDGLQQLIGQRQPAKYRERIAELEAKLQVASDAIKHAQNNASWAEGKRNYHEQTAYYSEIHKKITE